MRRRKISEKINPNNPGGHKKVVDKSIANRKVNTIEQVIELLMKKYANEPELKALQDMIQDLKAPYKMSPPERKKILGPRTFGPKDDDAPYYDLPKLGPGKYYSQESVNEAGLHSEEDIQKMQRFLAAVKANPTLKQQFASLTMETPNPFNGGTNRPPKGAPNPFDGGTNRPPAPSGTPGKPRPGDAGLPQAERLREIQALGSMLQQSIEYSVEDLVKAVTAGDERAARNELGDLKRLFNEVIRAMADEAGIKAKLNPFGIKPPKPSQDKKVRPSNPTFKDIVTAPANEDIREASMIRRGKLKISEASEAAFVLAKNYSLPELNRMYKTKK